MGLSLSFVGTVNPASLYASTRTTTRWGRVRLRGFTGGRPRAGKHAAGYCLAPWQQSNRSHSPARLGGTRRVTIGRVTRTSSADEQVNSNSPISMTRSDEEIKAKAKSEQRKVKAEHNGPSSCRGLNGRKAGSRIPLCFCCWGGVSLRGLIFHLPTH